MTRFTGGKDFEFDEKMISHYEIIAEHSEVKYMPNRNHMYCTQLQKSYDIIRQCFQAIRITTPALYTLCSRG